MTAATGEADVRATVQAILDEIKQGGDAIARTADVRLEKYFPGANVDLTGRE